MSAPADRDLYRFLVELDPLLRPIHDPDRLLRAALRAVLEHFEASEGAVAVRRRSSDRVELAFTLPVGAAFDLALLDAFILRREPELPPDLLLGPVRRRGLAWGVVAIRRPGVPFVAGQGRALSRVMARVTEQLADVDRARVLEVRERIDRKIMEELRPKDLFYQILHGLRSLTHYDHSSALLVAEGDRLHLTAEQIAWRKGKSRRIGLELPLSPETRQALAAGQVFVFDRADSGFVERRGRASDGLAELLDYNGSAAPAGSTSHEEPPGRPEDSAGAAPQPDAEGAEVPGTAAARAELAPEIREDAILCAPLVTDDGLFGILKVAARRRATFGAWDAELLERFVPQAAIAIQNARRASTLETRMLAAEKKHVMAELVRGVAHDINNALGSVVPLVQQLRFDLKQGEPDTKVMAADLEQIETSLQVCRRIFGGMLAFARGAERSLGPADLRQAVKNARAVLEDGFVRRGIAIRLELEDDLPPLPGPQGDLEQILLNLLTNARDAMPKGGKVTIAAGTADGSVEIAIADTGRGIPEDVLTRVSEPFFTTKPQGNGLGLAICRSIVWELGGTLEIASRVGEGTRVTIRLPRFSPAARASVRRDRS